ncbi:4Fe-4S binding protein [Bacteroides sp. 519]|uniref:4Fe-4S binding protein n=1 Tax=Bacteroides sp. 519 TaxID=2302937 RepID=UPI0013D81B51|nr:4Fe-4S binding protein [Bacteroides sp. 519]NDV58741.1 4Fe-4S dicluster domain-containing protein [Bacteroides sp. 519]
MELTKAHLVYFSPTFTSKQVATAIVQGTGIENVSEIDLTYHSPGSVQIPANSLAIIVAPVYGGKIAPLAMKRMEEIKGDNTPAVLVAVYGNRAYEKALMELDIYAVRHGFSVIAAATFVGEHSFSSVQNPISQGRPDKDDLAYAQNLGREIAEKVLNATDVEGLHLVDVRAIQRPKQPFFPLLGFMRKVMALRKKNVPMPKAPVTDSNKCTHCGACVELCPNEAILAGDELHTIAEKCTRCCACVKGCTQDARELNTPMAPLLSKYFQKQKLPQSLI